MRKPLVIQLVSLVIAAAVAVLGSSFDASAAKRCITIAGKTVCIDDGQDKKSNNNNNPGNDGGSGNNDNPEGTNDTGNNGGGANDTSKSATDKPLDCSKAQCDAGYVKLDKPNKYGACCEPAEGFCPSDRPNGTPPNCCPQGTTFREGACWPTECGPGTVGVPPHCDRVCPPGKIKVDQTCYDPCPPTTVGTPPNCKCPEGQYWDDAAKVCKPKCTGGMVGTPPNCQCPTGTVLTNGTCQQCQGGKVRPQRAMQVPEGEGPVVRRNLQKMRGRPRSDRRPLSMSRRERWRGPIRRATASGGRASSARGGARRPSATAPAKPARIMRGPAILRTPGAGAVRFQAASARAARQAPSSIAAAPPCDPRGASR